MGTARKERKCVRYQEVTLQYFSWAPVNGSHDSRKQNMHIYFLITQVILASAFLPVGEELLLFLTRSRVLQKGKWALRPQGERAEEDIGAAMWPVGLEGRDGAEQKAWGGEASLSTSGVTGH